MNISLNNLSKNDTNIIKGFSILFIVLHNFLHWTIDLGENEFSFDPERIYHFFYIIGDTPSLFFSAFSSYFAIYTLQPLIFLSSYGLTKQYFKNPSISYKNYIIPRMVKIYSLILFGLVFIFIIFHQVYNLKHFLLWAVSKFTMIGNFSYDTLFLYVGPWWYFGLAIEFYLIFPFLYKFIAKYDKKGFFILLIINYLLIYTLFPIAQSLNIPLYANFIGHLPVFILGIGLAHFTSWKLNFKILIPAILVFILSNFSEYFFHFSFLSSTIIILVIIFPWLFNLPETIKKILSYIGSISMFIFLINGPLRDFTMPYLVIKDHPLLTLGGSIIHLLIVILISILLSYIYKKTFQPLSSLLIKKLINKKEK